MSSLGPSIGSKSKILVTDTINLENNLDCKNAVSGIVTLLSSSILAKPFSTKSSAEIPNALTTSDSFKVLPENSFNFTSNSFDGSENSFVQRHYYLRRITNVLRILFYFFNFDTSTCTASGVFSGLGVTSKTLNLFTAPHLGHKKLVVVAKVSII